MDSLLFRCLLFGLSIAGLFVVPGASTSCAAGQVQLAPIEPTVLVDRADPPRQQLELSINNTGPPLDCRLRVRAGDRVVGRVDLGRIKTGKTGRSVLLPEPAGPITSQWVLLDAQDKTLAQRELTWKPPRHWQLYVLKSAHIDIGLHAEQYRQRDMVVKFIDRARQLADQTADWPPASRFRYVVEHLWWFGNYPADRSLDQVKRLVGDYIAPGLIGVGAGHSGNHTQEFGTEEFCRSAYFAREARERWGMPADCAIFADVTGMSWPLADIYPAAGIRYIGFYPNSWKGRPNLDAGIPKLFYWLGPGGRSRVLVWAGAHYTGSGRRFGIQTSGNRPQQTVGEDLQRAIAGQLRQLEKECPYDVWLVSNYADNEKPSLNFPTLARRWNEKWRWPELRTVGDPAVPFREVEERFGDRIPTLRGDITSSWAQHPVSTPTYLGRKRAADRLLTTAEKLATLARLNDPAFIYPTVEFRRAWDSLIKSDEHGYGVSPYKGKPVYVTWAHKRNWIDHALEVATSQSRRALAAIGAKIETEGPAVVVFNPLLHDRTDLVSFGKPDFASGPVQIVCPESGQVLPAETRDGRIVFVASGVPSLGYKTFRLVEDRAAAATVTKTTEPPVLENRFYRIVFSPDGAIGSIYDKEFGRELVDPKGAHKCNQFIFTWDDHKSFSSPGRATFEKEVTPLSRTVVARMDEAHSGAAITQRVTIYSHEKRVDFDNCLQHVTGLIHEPRYQAYGYYAFPLDVPEATIRVQLNGCIARPHDDQCPIGTFDWLAVQDWVDVSSAEYGVTIAQRQSHLVEFGGIRTNRNSHDYKPENGHLYSYIFNDWYQKNWTSPRDVNLRFEYSLRSHRGDYRAGRAARFGRRFAYPLLAVTTAKQQGPLPGTRCSFLAVDAPNADLLALKLSDAPGNGVIARLMESQGVAQTRTAVKVRSPLSSRFQRCSIVEEDGAAIQKPVLDFAPFEIATVRLCPSGRKPATLKVEAHPLGDNAIRLGWVAVDGASQYHVFRGMSEDVGSGVCHLLGTTTATTFDDEWLNSGTAYYYRVAAVSSENQQGAASRVVKAVTQASGKSPPAPVGSHYNGLIWKPCAWRGDSGSTLHVLWGQNRESDLAYYELHRSRKPHFVASSGTLVAKVPPGEFAVVSFDDTGLESGTTYYYRISAVDRDGRKSVFSESFCGTTRDTSGR